MLNKVIKEHDIVIHLACSTTLFFSEENQAKDIHENVIGTLNLLDVCKSKKIDKFIFFSSGGTVYGDINKLAKETYKTELINSHGVMKLSLENYVKIYKRMHDLDYLILRVANPYGR